MRSPWKRKAAEEKYFGLISSYTESLLFLAGQTKPFHHAEPGDSAGRIVGHGAARAGIQGSIPEASRGRLGLLGAGDLGSQPGRLCGASSGIEVRVAAPE